LKGCPLDFAKYSPGRNKKKKPNHISLFIALTALVLVSFFAISEACFNKAFFNGRTLLAAGSDLFQLLTKRE